MLHLLDIAFNQTIRDINETCSNLSRRVNNFPPPFELIILYNYVKILSSYLNFITCVNIDPH